MTADMLTYTLMLTGVLIDMLTEPLLQLPTHVLLVLLQ